MYQLRHGKSFILTVSKAKKKGLRVAVVAEQSFMICVVNCGTLLISKICSKFNTRRPLKNHLDYFFKYEIMYEFSVFHIYMEITFAHIFRECLSLVEPIQNAFILSTERGLE